MSVTCQVKNYKALRKQIDGMKKAPRKVVKAITSDAKKRVPGWVAAEVSKVYGVKKGEITGQKIGTVKPRGESIEQVQIVYTGRVLTPTHFGMRPGTPKPNGGSYTLKYRVVEQTQSKVKKLTKKQRAALAKNFTRSGSQKSDHSPIMLMHTGNARSDGTSYIPFQRKSADRDNVEAIKTVSLPQMVSSERVEAGIQTAINNGIGKRLDHHMKRYMGK